MYRSFITKAPLLISGLLFLSLVCIASEIEDMREYDSGPSRESILLPPASYLEWKEDVLNEDEELSTPIESITHFENLNLRQCIEIALATNFSLQNRSRDLMISQSRYREAKAEFIPSLTLSAEAGIGKDRTRKSDDNSDDEHDDGRVETHRNREKGTVKVLQNIATGGSLEASLDSVRDKSYDRSYTNEAGLRFTQPLLREGGFRYGLTELRTSELSLADEEIENALSKRGVALDVISQYYTILRNRQDWMVSLDALEEKRRFLEATRIKFNLDQIPESEISRAEIQYLQESDNVVTRKRSYEDQLERLLVILGLPLETKISLDDITKSLLRIEKVSLPSEGECVNEALANRLEFIRSDISIRRQKIELARTRNDLLPDLDFNFEYSSSDQAGSLGESYNLRNTNSWDASLSFSVPFPNIGRKESHKRALISLEKLETDHISLERDIVREVRQAYRQVKTNESSLRILKKTVEQALKSLEQERGRFDAGLSTSNDVRKAQDDLFETQSRYFTELLNYQINIAKLYNAIGRKPY